MHFTRWIKTDVSLPVACFFFVHLSDVEMLAMVCFSNNLSCTRTKTHSANFTVKTLKCFKLPSNPNKPTSINLTFSTTDGEKLWSNRNFALTFRVDCETHTVDRVRCLLVAVCLPTEFTYRSRTQPIGLGFYLSNTNKLTEHKNLYEYRPRIYIYTHIHTHISKSRVYVCECSAFANVKTNLKTIKNL